MDVFSVSGVLSILIAKQWMKASVSTDSVWPVTQMTIRDVVATNRSVYPMVEGVWAAGVI